ncbi:hypothetical protein, partial [Proteus mirabilis]|uniref:hypothetical protein n=1 Tax=Proteus mirabilis TaxID=584 RepID=UPI001952B5EF
WPLSSIALAMGSGNDQNSDWLNVWLLFILFHLPNNITANSRSLLRDLGKKCQNIILRNVLE